MYKIEVFLLQGNPLYIGHFEKYWVSCDEKLLHLKSSYEHVVIPFTNILQFKASQMEDNDSHEA